MSFLGLVHIAAGFHFFKNVLFIQPEADCQSAKRLTTSLIQWFHFGSCFAMLLNRKCIPAALWWSSFFSFFTSAHMLWFRPFQLICSAWCILYMGISHCSFFDNNKPSPSFFKCSKWNTCHWFFYCCLKGLWKQWSGLLQTALCLLGFCHIKVWVLLPPMDFIWWIKPISVPRYRGHELKKLWLIQCSWYVHETMYCCCWQQVLVVNRQVNVVCQMTIETVLKLFSTSRAFHLHFNAFMCIGYHHEVTSVAQTWYHSWQDELAWFFPRFQWQCHILHCETVHLWTSTIITRLMMDNNHMWSLISLMFPTLNSILIFPNHWYKKICFVDFPIVFILSSYGGVTQLWFANFNRLNHSHNSSFNDVCFVVVKHKIWLIPAYVGIIAKQNNYTTARHAQPGTKFIVSRVVHRSHSYLRYKVHGRKYRSNDYAGGGTACATVENADNSTHILNGEFHAAGDMFPRSTRWHSANAPTRQQHAM